MSRVQRMQQGFVLLATLWVLVVMALFVSYFAVLVAESQIQAIEIKADMQTQMDQQSTLVTLLYLAATRPLNFAGINLSPESRNIKKTLFGNELYKTSGQEIRFDGRPYKGLGDIVFSLQDAGSLISLRGKQFSRLEKLLEAIGVGRPQRTQMIANLKDYIDRDELLSTDGAEKRQYAARGMDGPTNRFLVSPMQIVNVISWNENLSKSQLNSLLSEITIYVGNRENYNSMTIKGMQTVGVEGIEPASIDKILSHRITESFSKLSEVNLLTGSLIPTDPLLSPLFPSKYLRVTFELPGRSLVEWVGVTLTPGGERGPWEIDYRFRVDKTNDLAKVSNAIQHVEVTTTPLFH